ncbi:hypothetical protein AB0D14_34755 [Streptomyces sp. NPDC048484]
MGRLGTKLCELLLRLLLPARGRHRAAPALAAPACRCRLAPVHA